MIIVAKISNFFLIYHSSDQILQFCFVISLLILVSSFIFYIHLNIKYIKAKNNIRKIIFYCKFNSLQKNNKNKKDITMNITYQKKVAPLEVNCCFIPQNHHQPFLSPSSKIFKNKNEFTTQAFKPQDKQKAEQDRKKAIQSMKKSISTISLKRKNSDGYYTNRTSLNQSQFFLQNKRLQKKMTTISMDSEVFKQCMPSYQNIGLQNNNNQYKPFNDLIESPLTSSFNNNDTLDSLAQKFKKNRQINVQPSNQTKTGLNRDQTSNNPSYQPQLFRSPIKNAQSLSSKSYLNLQKTQHKGQNKNKQIYYYTNNQVNYTNSNSPLLSNIKFLQRNQTKKDLYYNQQYKRRQMKNPEDEYEKFDYQGTRKNENIIKNRVQIVEKNNNNKQIEQYNLKGYTNGNINNQYSNNTLNPNLLKNNRTLEMNQVDSMIISVKQPLLNHESYNHKITHNSQGFKKMPFLNKKPSFQQRNKFTQSIHINDDYDNYNHKIDKTIKKYHQNNFYQDAEVRPRKFSQKNLHEFDNDTVNSDYQDEEHEVKKEKIQESAIMMNFFNPPSFIKDKLGLSKVNNNH